MKLRQIALDTETTGLEPSKGHRIIEIGCIEMIDRKLTGNNFHVYINPERQIDAEAQKVHGISNAFLTSKPTFAEISDDFFTYVNGAQLIIHNAPFDIGFLNHEFKMLGTKLQKIERYCSIIDTLEMARKMHPGQKNSLDALCKRYAINNSHRSLHGALVDADLLINIYLAMTGGQTELFAEMIASGAQQKSAAMKNAHENKLLANQREFRIILPAVDELAAHQQRIIEIHQKSKKANLWDNIE